MRQTRSSPLDIQEIDYKEKACYNKRKIVYNMKLLSDLEKRKLVEQLDLEIWSAFAPEVEPGARPGILYHCYCPYCQAKTKKREKTSHNLTAVVYRHQKGWGQQGDGLGFFCASCGTRHPRIYEFLGKGSEKAEVYAWKRFEIDAVGKGWYCPHPERWKELSELDKQRKAANHKSEAERRKRENQVAYALCAQEALKAATPITPK